MSSFPVGLFLLYEMCEDRRHVERSDLTYWTLMSSLELYSTALSTVMSCTVYKVSCITVQDSAVQYSTALYWTGLCGTGLGRLGLCCTELYCTILYRILFCTILYCTGFCTVPDFVLNRTAPLQHPHLGPAVHGSRAGHPEPPPGRDWPRDGAGRTPATPGGPGRHALHGGRYNGDSAVCQRCPPRTTPYVRQVCEKPICVYLVCYAPMYCTSKRRLSFRTSRCAYQG